jgi:sugar phosphate isomerase/epimerase
VDWANLVVSDDPVTHRDVLSGLLDAVDEAVVALHAKDCVSWDFTLAGSGVLDFSHLMKVAHLRLPGRPVIVQNTTADQAPKVLRFLAGERAT